MSATILYVLDCDHGTKVGITIQTIEQRIDDLERGSGLRDIRLVRTWDFDSHGLAYQVEHAAHWILRDTRTVGEWFHCHPIEACSVVDDLIAHGLPLLEMTVGVEAARQIRARVLSEAA